MKKTSLFLLAALAGHIAFGQCDNVSTHCFNGNALDGSSNGNNGTLNGGVSLTTDRFSVSNKAYSFDGTNDYISLPTTDYQIDEFTYSAWINITTNPTSNQYQCIMQFGGTSGDQAIMLANHSGNGHVGLGVHSYDANSTAQSAYIGSLPTTATWTHITMTRTNNTAKMYIDGVLDTTFTLSGLAAQYGPTTYATFGARRGAAQYYNGKLDDIRIYDCALTSVEVLSLYQLKNCGDTCIEDTGASSIVINILGLENVTEQAEYTAVYPNPSNGPVHLKLSESAANVTVSVLQIDGRIVSEETYSHTSDIDLDLPKTKGTYIIRINIEGKLQEQIKVLVE